MGDRRQLEVRLEYCDRQIPKFVRVSSWRHVAGESRLRRMARLYALAIVCLERRRYELGLVILDKLSELTTMVSDRHRDLATDWG